MKKQIYLLTVVFFVVMALNYGCSSGAQAQRQPNWEKTKPQNTDLNALPSKESPTEKLPQDKLLIENNLIKACHRGDGTQVWDKQTGALINIDTKFEHAQRITGKPMGSPPLADIDISEGVKLVNGSEIYIIGIKPQFKLLSHYPHPKTKQDKLIIDKGTNTLFLYKNGDLYKTYPVATGKDPVFTPEGSFKIANKIKADDQHDLKPQLGSRWMGISVPCAKDNRAQGDQRAPIGSKYGIHGTDEPDSIGKYASGGCIRVDNEQVMELFELVAVGTTVEIR